MGLAPCLAAVLAAAAAGPGPTPPPRLAVAAATGLVLFPGTDLGAGIVVGARAALRVTRRAAATLDLVRSAHRLGSPETYHSTALALGLELDADATPVVATLAVGLVGYRFDSSGEAAHDWGGYLGLGLAARPLRHLAVGAELRYGSIGGVTAFPATITLVARVGWTGL